MSADLKQLAEEEQRLVKSIDVAQHTLDAIRTVQAYLQHRNGGKEAPEEPKQLPAPPLIAVDARMDAGFWDTVVVEYLQEHGPAKASDIWQGIQQKYRFPDDRRSKFKFYQGIATSARNGRVTRDGGIGALYSLPAPPPKRKPKTKAKSLPKPKSKRATRAYRVAFPWKEEVIAVLRERQPLTSAEIWEALQAKYNLEPERRQTLTVSLPYLRRKGYVVKDGEAYTLGSAANFQDAAQAVG